MILQLCTPTLPHTIAPAQTGRSHAARRLVRLWSLLRMPDAKEADLIERAKTGDRASFSALVRVHQRRVYACAIHMLGDRGEAEDAVQETFLRAFRAIDRFDGRAELST